MAAVGCPVRNASHAGSWYTDDPRELQRELTEWLGAADSRHTESARAIISPHAGYSYSGRVAAFAYKQIVPETVTAEELYNITACGNRTIPGPVFSNLYMMSRRFHSRHLSER